MNIKQLKRVMKPTVKQAKKVYLTGYIEDTDTTTISYCFKGQKESHLKIPVDTWNGMKFEVEDDKVIITNLNGLKIVTNDSGWSRLLNEDDADE